MSNFLPNAKISFVEQWHGSWILTGPAFRALNDAFRSVAEQSGNYTALVAQVAQLESDVIALDEDKADKSVQLIGGGSINLNTTLASPVINFELFNDTDVPGAYTYYGADTNGTKGWLALAAIMPRGNATLVAGTVAVSVPSITAGAIVILGPKTAGGTPAFWDYTVSAGVGFTITSANPLDTSTVSYLVLEP